MDRLRKMLEAHGINNESGSLPLTYPNCAGDQNSIHAAYWENWCKRFGVDFLNYFPVFCAVNETPQGKKAIIQNYFIKGDPHWNREGHRLITRVFLERFGETYQGRKAVDSTDHR